MQVDKIKELLNIPRKVVITTHYKPDGDAIGSSLGLYNYLLKKGHHVSFISPSDYPEFLHWMAGNDQVIDITMSPKKAEAAVTEAEVIFCLDFNRLHRCESVAPLIAAAQGFKVNIDHHLEPETFCDIALEDSSASSTAELIYRFIVAMGDIHLIDQDIAECIYTGIMTDTASFRFESATADTYEVAADLIRSGARNYVAHASIYDVWSEDRIRLVGYCTNEKMQVFNEFNTAVIGLSKEELNRFNYKTGDTEGIVNIPLSIKNIRFSAFFVERKDEVKISFRSKDDFSVRDFSAKYFEGGGHKNASGGRSSLSLEDTIKRFISLLPEYKGELTR
jgi:phosphoesterase RecJ-like protein